MRLHVSTVSNAGVALRPSFYLTSRNSLNYIVRKEKVNLSKDLLYDVE